MTRSAPPPVLPWLPAAADNGPGKQPRYPATDVLLSTGCTLSGCWQTHDGKSGATHQNLQERGFVPSGEHTFACPATDGPSRYAANDQRLIHEQKHEAQKPYPCPWEGCNKRFARTANVKIHCRVHSGERPFACPHEACHKRFRQRMHLNYHLRIHSGEKPYLCPEAGCSMRFAYNTNIKSHLRIHRELRPFRCHHEGCGRGFKSRKKRDSHLRAHTRENPYVCHYPDCGKGFSQHSNLVAHLRVHSGEKPFACGYDNCGKRFRQRHHLNNHLRTHAKDKAATGPLQGDLSLLSHSDDCAQTAKSRQSPRMHAAARAHPGMAVVQQAHPGMTEQDLHNLRAPVCPRLPPVPLSADCLSWLACQTASATPPVYQQAAGPDPHEAFRQWLMSPGTGANLPGVRPVLDRQYRTGDTRGRLP